MKVSFPVILHKSTGQKLLMMKYVYLDHLVSV